MTGVKKYIVRLTESERTEMNGLVRKKKVAGYKRMHAQVLLSADQGEHGPELSDEKVAAALGVAASTVHNVRKRWIELGLEAALGRKKQEQPSRPRKLDGRAEARVIAVACSAPPAGRAKWTMQLMADELVRLEVVDTLSDETVRRTLKKTTSSPTSGGSG